MGIKILLVDDSSLIINRLRKMLVGINNISKIESAGTLEEARVIMNRDEIQTVVLDINLPDGNGIKFLKWLKPTHPEVRVIMLSNMANDYHRKAAKNAGADYFFDKTEEFEEVVKILSV